MVVNSPSSNKKVHDYILAPYLGDSCLVRNQFDAARSGGLVCDTQLVINSNLKHIVLRTALESVLGCHMGTKKGVALGSSVG